MDVPGEELENDDREIETFLYNGIDLLALGGATFREKALNIANHLWNEDERIKFCIEPEKTLTEGREKADKERSDVMREVMKVAVKQDFSEECYRSILQNVNQQGVDMGFRRRKLLQKNEAPNEVPDANSA